MSSNTIMAIAIILVLVENAFVFLMLKGVEKLVQMTGGQHERYRKLYENVMEYYEICMKSNKSVDEHYKLVSEQQKLIREQYEDVKTLCNLIIEQEEN